MEEKTENVGWEHFEHQADIGIRGFGPTKERAFEQTALALTAVITTVQKVQPNTRILIHCQDDDDELLLIDWLSALLYQMAIHKMLFSRFNVRINNGRLNADAWGEKINIAKHRPAVEVKAATYNALKVHQKNELWFAQCVVDV